MSLYAIPDIHGRYDLLIGLLKQLDARGFDPTRDKLIFLGDMIDRGPDSKRVVDHIRMMVESEPGNIIALAGNHEWMAVHALTTGSKDFWEINGGWATSASYGGVVPEDVIRWFSQLPLYHEESGFFFSHAPVPREKGREKENLGKPFTKHELTWTYERPNYVRDHGNGVVGVCGHIHALREGLMAPRFYDHYIFADAGCGCSNNAPLVAIEVNTREVIFEWPKEAQE